MPVDSAKSGAHLCNRSINVMRRGNKWALKTPIQMNVVLPQDRAYFLVYKGFRMGSKWFEELMNRVKGVNFKFELHHCFAEEDPEASHNPDNMVNKTLSYLRSSCNCVKAKCFDCVEDNQKYPCIASGFSLVNYGRDSVMYVRQLYGATNFKLVMHVRTNHVKHAVSFMRTTCAGQHNHAYETNYSMFAIDPQRLISRSMMASRTHYRLTHVPDTLGIEPVYYVIYEILQQNPEKEIENVLRAVGVSSYIAWKPQVEFPLVKQGSDLMNETLTNYNEVELAFGERPCLLRMLKAHRFQSFNVKECVMNRSARVPVPPVPPMNNTLTAKECNPY